MTRYRIAALIFIAAVLPARAQIFPGMPGMPEMPGGKPVIVMPGGGWSGIDCKQMQEILSKSVGAGMGGAMGMMAPEALLKMMGCAPAPQSAPQPAAPAPAPAASSERPYGRCEMFSDLSFSRPQMWLGPHQVLSALDLSGCRLSPSHQQLVDGLRYFGEGRLEQSAATLQALASNTQDPALRSRALAELAKTHLAARQPAQARAVIDQGLALTAAPVAAREEPRRVISAWPTRETEARADAEYSRTQIRVELLILMGIALAQTNDLPSAIARYREAKALARGPNLGNDPRDLALYDVMEDVAAPYLAAALIRAGQTDEARLLLQGMVKGREQTVEMATAMRNMQGVFDNSPIPIPGSPHAPLAGANIDGFAMTSGDIMLTPFTCAALAAIEIKAQSAERALEAVEQCRARALAELLANRAFHAPVRAASVPSIREILAKTSAADQEKRVAEMQAAFLNPNPRAREAARPATIGEMRRMAAERNATLVVYAIDYESAALPVRMPDHETGIMAWVVSPDGRVHVRRRALEDLFTGSALSLSAAALRLRESMGVPGRGAVRATTAALRATTSGGNADLKRFYQLLIDPIIDLLPVQEGSRLIIVPERALFLVPFAALENSAGEPLIARHAISVTPSLQTLALAALRKRPAGDTAPSVVVGNPLMPSYTPRPGGRPMDIPPLPGAEAEAYAVAALLKSTALTGATATKSTVLAQSANARYVHLATHGFLDRFTNLAQSGVNPHVREVALLDERTGGGLITPGMLALAPSGRDGGMLSADEIAQSTTTAELVVMSACDSGRGAINDDGVIGLSRAWMAAGAPSVMVTLWTIPDDATKDLMVTFYQQLMAGTRKAEALRLAMLATRAKYPDPFNWAAFMLIGEPD